MEAQRRSGHPREHHGGEEGEDEDAPEAEGRALLRSLRPEEPAVARRLDLGGDIRRLHREGDGVGQCPGATLGGKTPFHDEILRTGLERHDDGVATFPHGNGASVVIQRGDLGSCGQADREILAEAGAQREVQGRSHLATSGIHGVHGGIDRDGGAFDRLRSRNGEGRAFARPGLPERHELSLEVFEERRDAGEGDVPDRRSEETPLLAPSVGFAGGKDQVVDRREFTLPGSFLLVRCEAHFDRSALDGAALADDFFSAEERHADGGGAASGRKALHRGRDAPDETKLDLALDEEGVFCLGAVVGGGGGLLAANASEDHLILGGAVGSQTAHGPALGRDGDAAWLQGKPPFPFSEIAEPALHGQLVDAGRGQEDPEMTVATQRRGGFAVAEGGALGNEGGEGHRHGHGATVGGVIGQGQGEGLALELQVGRGKIGGPGEGVGCLGEALLQFLEEVPVRELCLHR